MTRRHEEERESEELNAPEEEREVDGWHRQSKEPLHARAAFDDEFGK